MATPTKARRIAPFWMAEWTGDPGYSKSAVASAAETMNSPSKVPSIKYSGQCLRTILLITPRTLLLTPPAFRYGIDLRALRRGQAPVSVLIHINMSIAAFDGKRMASKSPLHLSAACDQHGRRVKADELFCRFNRL